MDSMFDIVIHYPRWKIQRMNDGEWVDLPGLLVKEDAKNLVRRRRDMRAIDIYTGEEL